MGLPKQLASAFPSRFHAYRAVTELSSRELSLHYGSSWPFSRKNKKLMEATREIDSPYIAVDDESDLVSRIQQSNAMTN